MNQAITYQSIAFYITRLDKLLVTYADFLFPSLDLDYEENIQNIITLSAFRSQQFGSAEHYGVMITDGPLAGLFSRAIVIINSDKKVIYNEQVPEITNEPNYEAALKAIR